MATINPSQDYDLINTLTFNSASGTCRIRLYRGSGSAFTGTVYYRAGTSGSWTTLSVSGTSTTFPVSNTTMQLALDWTKSGDDYMTPSFSGQATNLTDITMSQKAVLSGVIGSHFMTSYAFSCESLISLDAPDTSLVTSVGNQFMGSYAIFSSSLASVNIPDTSSVTSIGTFFMASYVRNCTPITSLGVPDTSSVTSAGHTFMQDYASNCTALTKLILPSAGWFASNNIDWAVPSGRLGNLIGRTSSVADQTAWQALVTTGNTLHTNFIRASGDVTLFIPTAPKRGNFFMFT